MNLKMNKRGTWTLFKRENKRFMKVWLQTLLAPVVSNLLYFAVFGLSLRATIMEVQGIGYLEFLVPGLIVMGLVNNTYQNPSSSLIIMKYQQLLSDLMIIPLKRFELTIAFIGSALLRGTIISSMIFILSLFFVRLPYVSVLLIFITGLLIALFFAFLGLLVGIWADDFDNSAFIQNFILIPLMFLGGVFFPISNLPSQFLTVSYFNPMFHMINLFRYAFTGIVEFSLNISMLILVSGTVFLATITYFVLRSGWKLQN